MLTGNGLKFVMVAILLVVTPVLNNCAWREGPPCDEVVMKGRGGEPGAAASDSDVQALKDQVSDLERRLAANERLADSAMMTAQRALDCCRKDYQILYTEHIYFDFNKANVRANQQATLDKVAERLKSDPDLIAELSGFADAVGSDEYNIVLGQRRAESARDYLVTKHQINASRMSVRSFGESAAVHPPTASEEVREADRRVTIDILGYKQ